MEITMRYKIIKVESLVGEVSEIQNKVREEIDNGWTPHGGISVFVLSGSYGRNTICFAQAMVKE